MVAPARRPLRSSLEGSAGMSAWEPVIGLEMHVELDTRTKMFCACEVTKGDEPNTHTCPKCLAHPGALPVVNQRAVEYAARIALALNCSVRPRNIFHRKNYFYPDLPKAYQISQYDEPLAVLADLIRLGQVGIEVVLAVEDVARPHAAVERQGDTRGVLDGALVDHGQRAGVRETLGTGVRVGLVALGDLAGAEHLGARVELHVHLEPDHRLPGAHSCASFQASAQRPPGWGDHSAAASPPPSGATAPESQQVG